jgi:polyhydroxybutyrate depolymerase
VTLGPDGDQRDVILHLPPAYDGSSQLPLLIVLHGGGGSGRQIHEQIGMDADADDFGFVVAYPNGSGRLGETLLTWNAGHCCGYSLDKNIDDVGFLSALIDLLLADYAIDPARVYVAGMSNGAMMAYRAGAELSEKIAGIAPVAGSIGGQPRVKYPAVSPEPPAEPVALMAFHGMQDQHVLYDGGMGPEAFNQGRIDFSVEKSIAFWVEANGCNPDPFKESHFDGNIQIDDYYDDCLGNSAVVLVTIVDGGHAWPGAKSGVGDQPSQQISANEMMLEFFLARPKSSEQ